MATFADVVEGWIENPKRLIWVGISFLVLLIGIFGLIAGLDWLFSINGTEVKLTSEGTQIFFQTASTEKTYYVVVHPQGWQNTLVPVKKGNRIRCKAQGSVNVSLQALIDYAELRHGLEEKYVRKYHIDGRSMDVPENHFTAKEWQSLRLNRPWTGPDGLVGFAPTYQGHLNTRLLPKEALGALIGAVRENSSFSTNPTRQDAFLIGSNHEFDAPSDGYLWMAANDDSLDGPNMIENLYRVDNIGFYSVVVTVDSGTKDKSSWFGK